MKLSLLYLGILVNLSLINLSFSIVEKGPFDDAKIVPGSKTCNKEWSPVDIKNISSSKSLTVTVRESRTLNGIPKNPQNLVFSNLAPKEQRELGCNGCGNTTSGFLCVSYTVVAAVYVK